MASLKRRHEDSSFAPHLSEYSLRKEPQPARNVSSLSTETTNNYALEEDRVHSPNSVMDTHAVFNPPRESKRTLSFASKRDTSYNEDNDPDAEKRVTIWNWREQRKLSGNSAPFKKNLRDYIRKHPDWEQYVGQDKDAITGKKLSPKKMKPPAPIDPDHPWYTNGGMPQSPSSAREASATPHTSSYGTRSSQSRLQESENRTQESRSSHAEPQQLSVNLELFQPFSVVLEDPATVVKRRAAEVAARRQSMAAEASEDGSGMQTTEEEALEVSRRDEAEWAAAFAAASEKVAAERAEKEAAERKAAEEALNERRTAHFEAQGSVVSTAMARIEARKKRRMTAA
jgi:hypothetical protein